MPVPAAVLERGGSLQPWHAVGGVAGWAAIAPTQAVAMRPASILVLDADALRQRIDASSPKFVFAVLRALVGALPAPRQAGGGTIKRMQSILSDDDDSDEDAASSVLGSRGAPSPLEKVLLLRDTKMLSFAAWKAMFFYDAIRRGRGWFYFRFPQVQRADRRGAAGRII